VYYKELDPVSKQGEDDRILQEALLNGLWESESPVGVSPGISSVTNNVYMQNDIEYIESPLVGNNSSNFGGNGSSNCTRIGSGRSAIGLREALAKGVWESDGKGQGGYGSDTSILSKMNSPAFARNITNEFGDDEENKCNN
jgi:hypothetical protein